MNSREQFEKWWLDSDSTSKEDLQEHEHIKGDYVHLPAQCAWEAWQASRAALFVEFPACHADPLSVVSAFRVKCVHALKRVGITVS